MIKKLYIFSVCFLLFIMFMSLNTEFIFEKEKSHYLYIGENSSNCLILSASEYKNTFNIKGESCVLSAENFSLEKTLKKYGASVVFSEEIEGVIIYYARSPKIKYSAEICGKIINITIAVREKAVTLGSPIIFGSF